MMISRRFCTPFPRLADGGAAHAGAAAGKIKTGGIEVTMKSKRPVRKKDKSARKPLRAAMKPLRLKIFRVPLQDIVVPEERERPNCFRVDCLVQSMLDIGLVVPIAVRRTTRALVLVDGLARLEAARVLGWEDIEVVAIDGWLKSLPTKGGGR
jgi:ParB-like nuclease domain